MMEVQFYLVRSALQEVIVMRALRRVWTFSDGRWVEIERLPSG